MKCVLLLTPLVCGLLLSAAQATASVQVFSSDTESYCQSLAQMVNVTANSRSLGLTIEHAYAIIDSKEGPADQAWDLKYVADYVFTYPHKTPSEEGNDIYSICRNGL